MTHYLTAQKMPFNMSYRAFKYFEKISPSYQEADILEVVAWCGFRAGHEKEKKEFSLKVEDMADLFDEEMELVGIVSELFAEALPSYQEQQKKILLLAQKFQPVQEKKTTGKKSKK